MTNRMKISNSRSLAMLAVIFMIIIALVMSASNDVMNKSSISNGSRISALHMAALAKVYAIKTPLSNGLENLQIIPRLAKRNSETFQELAGTQTRHARYSTSLTGKADKETSLNSSLINYSMPLSSSLLTLMKLSLNGSNYNNHSSNANTINNTSSSSSAQPSNRIVRREIVSQTQLARETIQNRGSVPSEKGPRIALIKPTFTAAAYANGFYKFYKLYNTTPVGKNVTTDLNLLSVPVNASWYPSLPYVFSMLKLLNDIKSISHNSNITIYDDTLQTMALCLQRTGVMRLTLLF